MQPRAHDRQSRPPHPLTLELAVWLALGVRECDTAVGWESPSSVGFTLVNRCHWHVPLGWLLSFQPGPCRASWPWYKEGKEVNILFFIRLLLDLNESICISDLLSGRESACQCRGRGFDPWVKKILGGGNGNPLRCGCLGSPRDRGAWRAAVRMTTGELGMG